MSNLAVKPRSRLPRIGITLFAAVFFALAPLSTANAQLIPAGPVFVVNEQPFTLSRIADALAWTAAKTVIQSMTQSIVNWINSGFQGSPAFITDLNRNLGNLADSVADDFIRGLDQVVTDNTGFSIRAPFQDQLNAALREEFYRTTSSYGFNARFPYRNCYANNEFSLGGFFCESQNPANNPYGRYELARNELFRRIDQESKNRLRELDWGRGFLSWRGPCGPNGTGAQTAGPGGVGGSVDLSSRDTTVGCSIRTPGAIIEESLGITVNSPLRQLELADSMNEVLAALMTQLVNQVLGGNGLIGVSQPTSGGGSSYLDRATNPATTLSSGFAASITQLRTQVVSTQGSWQQAALAAASAERACAGTSSKQQQASAALATANERVTDANSLLGKLDQFEARRVSLTNSSTASPQEVTQLMNDFDAFLRDPVLRRVVDGSAETTSAQMAELERSCR